jgi:hypothetical protein
MPTEEISEGNPIEIKRVFGFADFLYVLLLFVMYVFEHAFIEQVWLKPEPAMDLAMKIPLQGLVLMPLIAGLKARIKMGKKLKAGEISAAYASDLSTWIVFLLCLVYLTFTSLVAYVPH